MCSDVYRLVLLRIIRPDSVVSSVRAFIATHLGEEFSRAPQFDLAKSFRESDCTRPLVLLLSPGTDPLAAINGFTPDEPDLRPEGKVALSLGQGQVGKIIPI